ncbi:hypothetical protein O181_116880 [Austropuccinia psidii MF-1]|uniref:Uncharacterized protein n=1 Tax=Austropuccinia psidii MF-1 TaxID=1389203 RepID=A0A9Q3KDC1_9BASI|nr:hypothetical protein [Austropuccinia psidii MF-1]
MKTVHTRTDGNYSVQPDGSGQGRGKTKSRSPNSSSRKTHLEDARAAPHSPRSVPTNSDVNSEPELIEGNILSAEPLSSSSHINISVSIQKLDQRRKGRGVGNMPKPLEGVYELLLTHQEISVLEEDHRALKRLEPISLQRQGQKDKELVEEPKSFIHIPEGIGNDSSLGRRSSNVYHLQTSSRSIEREAQRTSEEEERSQEPSRQGKRKSQLAQTLPTRVQDPQIGAFSHGQCLQYGQKSYGTHSQRAGKDEHDFSMKIIDAIHFFKSSIDVELGKFDAKLNKIILDLRELKRNYKKYTEWYQLTNVRLDSITNTCDRIESKCQVQNDEMQSISILKINDQLGILKDHVLEIKKNTNQFATHLEKSDSERHNLKNEIIANVEQIHKKYEPHMPSHSTPFTEEKLSVKGSLTPFLGESFICAKDIPKLEEWPKFPGEGEYNHIEFIRTIDMLQEYFHIPVKIIVGKLHSLFARTAKRWYYKMRLDLAKHDFSWWKSEIITKWAKISWRFKMENTFESAIFNSEKDILLTWSLKQKERLSALHPDISDSMINMKILRKCGGELEHAIKCRCVEPCSK